MYSPDNTYDMKEFKANLKRARKESNLTQKELAEILHLSRPSIAQWEDVDNDRFPTLKDFVKICSLLKVDPDYLLGKSNIESSNNKAISDAIGISYSNIEQLRNNNYTNRFLDFLLSEPKSQYIINRIEQVCYYKFIYEAIETTFLPDGLKKITKAFEKFYRKVSPLDMNVDNFEEYLRKEMPWKFKSLTIDEFIHSTITKNEYNNILFTWPNFKALSDNEQYDILMHDIAVTSYDYMTKQPIIDLSQLEIIKTFDSIVDAFINAEVLNFKNRNK